MTSTAVLHQILEVARWAPSGDNTQVWRFELAAPDRITVHCHDTRTHCVYDLDGRPSQLSHGVLLETIAIAASAHGLRTDCTRQAASAEMHPVYDIVLRADPAVVPSPLLGAIPRRSVQRRPMATRPLSNAEKHALEQSVGPEFSIAWIEGFGPKWRAAKLMFDNAKLRLTMPEAYETHRKVIQWDVSESTDRIPDKALGVDAATLRLMKWAMASWPRLATMNKLMGTWAPRLQMDLLPGLACGAHFVINAHQPATTIDDYVAAGRAVQRFWLTAEHLGLQLQPELTPLIFGGYVRNGVRFSRVEQLQTAATRLLGRLDSVVGSEPARAVFMGRIGAGPVATARSVRLSVDQLMK